MAIWKWNDVEWVLQSPDVGTYPSRPPTYLEYGWCVTWNDGREEYL
jgi:hypothetical protein